MKLVITLFMSWALLIYGEEVNFDSGRSKRAELLNSGRIRISEEYDLKGNTSKLLINNFPSEVDRKSLTLSGVTMESLVFSMGATSTESLERQLKGKKVIGRDKKYEVVSLTPIILKDLENKKLIFNPNFQFEVAGDEIELGSALDIRVKEGKDKLTLGYEYKNLYWDNKYELNLDDKTIFDMLILRNNTEYDVKNLVISYNELNTNIDLLAKTEGIVKGEGRKVTIKKDYRYRSSQGGENPNLDIHLKESNGYFEGSIRVSKNGRYIGNGIIKVVSDGMVVKGLKDKKIAIRRDESQLNFGKKLGRRDVQFSIENNSSEEILIEIIYDDLPKKWYELKSKAPYSLGKNEVVFKVKVPANDITQIKFSYITENI